MTHLRPFSKILQEKPDFVKIQPLPRCEVQTIWDQEQELEEASKSCSSIMVASANRKFADQKKERNVERRAGPHVQWWGSTKLKPYYTEYDGL